jgi:choline dehydrogenase
VNANSFDYVVVGGGSAGSVMASRLSEEPAVRVLLLEAGASEGPPAMSVASEWLSLLGSSVDWNYQTVEQPGLGGRSIAYPRGKVLGGSSSINGMQHTRGPRFAIDAWTSAGAPGWGYDDLLPYYRRSEHTEGRDTAYRGVGGPMTPQPVKRVHPFAADCLAAFGLLGYPVVDDLNGEQAEGASLNELTAVDGIRQSAADAYLRPVMDRPNLTVVTEALVERLEFVCDRCELVHYRRHEERHTATAAREVVLCAGAIGSPQLLMLSGIGPADHLRSHGIDVVVDAPEVGENLADHPLTPVTWRSIRYLEPGVNQHADVYAALRTAPSSPYPDVHLVCVNLPLAAPGLDAEAPFQGFSIVVGVLNPHSRGTVRLVSGRPQAAPLIDPALLSDERDLTTLLAGVRMAREVVASPALDSWRGEEVFPGQAADGNGLREYARNFTGTYFHPVGTCRMGTDTTAVVDLNLRVRGVEGLRVVDASVMPSIPAANTNATVLAIAERAAAIVTGDDSAGG